MWNDNIPPLSCCDNSVKNWRNLLINNPRSDLYNINAYTKFRKKKKKKKKKKNIYSIYRPETKYGRTHVRPTCNHNTCTCWKLNSNTATVLMNKENHSYNHCNGLKRKTLKHLPNSGIGLFKAMLSASEEFASGNSFKKDSVLLKYLYIYIKD